MQSVVSEMIYPVRIDSAFVKQQNQKLISETFIDTTINPLSLLYHPSQLKIPVQETEAMSANGNILRGWFYDTPQDPAENAILIVHDYNESKISYMQTCRNLSNMGFYVFCFDLPAHGSSEGEVFSAGHSLSNTLSNIIDTIFCQPQVSHVSILAAGISCYAAANNMLDDGRADVLVLENPVDRFSDYLFFEAEGRLGVFCKPVFPLIKRMYRNKTGDETDSLNLSVLINQLTKPALISITKENPDEKTAADALRVFENCKSPVKKMWTEKSKGFLTNINDVEKNYYRAIAAFINSNTPKQKVSKRRPKKLAAIK